MNCRGSAYFLLLNFLLMIGRAIKPKNMGIGAIGKIPCGVLEELAGGGALVLIN